jgi:hypothetical protein
MNDGEEYKEGRPSHSVTDCIEDSSSENESVKVYSSRLQSSENISDTSSNNSNSCHETVHSHSLGVMQSFAEGPFTSFGPFTSMRNIESISDDDSTTGNPWEELTSNYSDSRVLPFCPSKSNNRDEIIETKPFEILHPFNATETIMDRVPDHSQHSHHQSLEPFGPFTSSTSTLEQSHHHHTNHALSYNVHDEVQDQSLDDRLYNTSKDVNAIEIGGMEDKEGEEGRITSPLTSEDSISPDEMVKPIVEPQKLVIGNAQSQFKRVISSEDTKQTPHLSSLNQLLAIKTNPKHFAPKHSMKSTSSQGITEKGATVLSIKPVSTARRGETADGAQSHQCSNAPRILSTEPEIARTEPQGSSVVGSRLYNWRRALWPPLSPFFRILLRCVCVVKKPNQKSGNGDNSLNKRTKLDHPTAGPQESIDNISSSIWTITNPAHIELQWANFWDDRCLQPVRLSYSRSGLRCYIQP